MTARGPLRPERLVAMVLLAGLAPLADAGGLALSPGDAAPGLRGYDLEGVRQVVAFEAHRFTLVNFWATWCEPCRAEMPALAALHAELSGAGLGVYGVLVEQADRGAAREFVVGTGARYPIVVPDRRVRSQWQPAMLPATYLVDERGRIVRRYVGATKEQIEGLAYDVRAVLDGRPLGPLVIPETPAAQPSDARPTPHKPR